MRTSDLGNEALPCGIVECGAQTERERDQVDLLGRRDARHRQYTERRRGEQPGLGDRRSAAC